MPLRFYIDDSGKNDPPVFVLGGVTLDVDRVGVFEDAWRNALARPPAIPFFKMKDANQRRGAFKGLSVTDRNAKVRMLGETVREHAVAAVSVVVKHDDYNAVFAGRMMRWMDRPYQMMFHLTIANAYKFCLDAGAEIKADFVFDRQLEHEKALHESFPTLAEGLDPVIAAFLIGEPRHADDLNEVALQAADMVAWHVRRSWRDGQAALEGASSAGPSIAAIPGRHEVFGPAMLRQLADAAQGVARRLNTVFPYEAERIAEEFDQMATYANLHLIADARPFQPVELISFPATGTDKYRLVHNCEELGRPHLHKRSGNRCLGAASAA